MIDDALVACRGVINGLIVALALWALILLVAL